MATFRISNVLAKSNSPASARISSVQVLNSEPVPAANFRLAGVRVSNVPHGDAWYMSGGVWFSVAIKVRVGGVWV